ncbi:uncharacterized protein LOC121647506 [Melanotaenia boesemani]|uniref:uncharacterized protein LOC121647506 n=1 Tax=Melanotaenia boesemani TaxID=1250792 RepID=UPI001C04973C|nr:uncharacterized protein LOC121647506 [Melanotaenia boesemani]
MSRKPSRTRMQKPGSGCQEQAIFPPRGREEEACNLAQPLQPFLPPPKRRREEHSPLVLSLEAPIVPSSSGALLQSLSSQMMGVKTQGQVTQCHQALIQCHQMSPRFLLVPPNTLQHLCSHSGEKEQLKNAFLHPSKLLRAECSPKIKNTKKIDLKREPRLDPLSPEGGAHAPLAESSRRRGVVTSLEGDDMGPLASRMERWRACAVHSWVLSTVAKGYRLQFAMKPPKFNGVLASVANGASTHVLEEEIVSLLNKHTIRVVPSEEIHQGFYSRYFLIPKKRGSSLRPILDLRVLNKHLRKYTFRMLTHKVLCRSIRPNDWFVTIDLADAYFHIYPAHRKFLRFAYQGAAYEFQTIPFGLLLAPRVFSKCVEAALFPLRNNGIRIFSYMDDYLICSHSREQVIKVFVTVLNHLKDLGFRINEAKSRLEPAQCTEYLGLSINSLSYRVRLSDARVTAFSQCLALFQLGKAVSFRLCLRLLGLMASVIFVVRLGLLMMRDLQRWVASLHLSSQRHLHRRVRITAQCITALRPWRDPTILTSGVPLGAVSSRVTMTTDASLSGGADLLSRGNPLYGEWRLHPHVVAQIWQRYGQADVDLFASQENTHCPLFFSLSDVSAPLGVDALAHQWPDVLLYAFPPLSLISPTLARVREQGLTLILVAPRWPSKHWIAAIIQLLADEPWPLPIRRDLLSQARGEIYHPHPDRLFRMLGLPPPAPFTVELLDKGKAFSTIKVYLAAISACHVGFGDKSAGQHPLVCRFMKGAHRKLPVSRPLVPLWDLLLVLDALSNHPFEPIVALAPGRAKAHLQPNPAFVPKVMGHSYRCPSVELLAFHPPPFSSEEDKRLHTLCPVRALWRLSHWIVEAISVAYRCKGSQPPLGVRAHSTRSMASSWALFRGVPVRDTCTAASWATPHAFVRFYRLNVVRQSLSHTVLEAGVADLG